MDKSSIKYILVLAVLSSFLIGCTQKPIGFSQSDIIYFIMTDRFNDGDLNNNYQVDKNNPKKIHGGDIRGIIEKLDYIKELGATAIWITPIMKNEKDGYHGYWIEDFYEIDPHLGTLDDMKLLVKEAHKKNIKIILDYVVNHTGYNSPWLKDEKYNDWFNENKTITNWNNQKEVEDGWLMGLPDLNHHNPEVNNYFIENALWWIKETGIDGMRLDTVKHVPREFWAEFVSAIKKEYPNFYFLGEVWSENAKYLKTYSETGIDGMTNYPMLKGINTTFGKYGNSKNIKTAIKNDISTFEEPGLNGIFIDNHDNIRFISRHKENGDKYLKQALTFTMTYPAIPIIYYGTEIGMEGLDDPDNRRDMEWDKTYNSTMIEYYKCLVALRNEIKDYDFKLLEIDNNYLAYLREFKDKAALIVINIKDDKRTVEIDVKSKTRVFTSIFNDKKYSVKDGKMKLELEPLEVLVLDN